MKSKSTNAIGGQECNNQVTRCGSYKPNLREKMGGYSSMCSQERGYYGGPKGKQWPLSIPSNHGLKCVYGLLKVEISDQKPLPNAIHGPNTRLVGLAWLVLFSWLLLYL